MISIIYFGTHNFSATILESLIKSSLFDIKLVITQPDRPVGRKKEIQFSPIKILALKYNLKIDQPETLKNYSLPIAADYNIVCQYGLIIPDSILKSAKKSSINVHTSLLPKYRGASPIQSALINGETETGITIMMMDEKMDHGAILKQEKISIIPDETYLQLSERMSLLSAELLIKTIVDCLDEKITPQEQNHNLATFCKELTKEDGRIDWTKTANEIYNLYRGLTPWPGIWTEWNEKRLKLLEIKPAVTTVENGKIIMLEDKIFAGCGQNTAIEILKLQIEGKNAMNAKEFINGFGKLLSF